MDLFLPTHDAPAGPVTAHWAAAAGGTALGSRPAGGGSGPPFAEQEIGWRVVARNYRDPIRRLEIDMLAIDGETLVIAEVKTRSSDDISHPLCAVDELKASHVGQAPASTGRRDAGRRSGCDYRRSDQLVRGSAGRGSRGVGAAASACRDLWMSGQPRDRGGMRGADGAVRRAARHPGAAIAIGDAAASAKAS